MAFFVLKAVEDSFRNVARHVASPLVAYVLGGAAMAKLGIKAATKDVDLVFRSLKELEAFATALAAAGAKRIHEPSSRAARAGARHLWETPDGMGWDLFVDNVIGFQFVDADYTSSEPWLVEGTVEYRRLASNLVFVMKAFTPRTRDIGDMASLISSGAATGRGVEELVAQRLSQSPARDWLPRFYYGVQEMADHEGIDVRWVERFEEEAALATAEPLVQGWLADGPLALVELARRLREPEEDARSLLTRLEARGKIRRVGDLWAIV